MIALDVSEPNLNSVLIALIQMLGTAFGIYIAYRQTRKGQDPKLDSIHTLVNGNLDVEKRKSAAWRQQLIDNGIEPKEIS